MNIITYRALDRRVLAVATRGVDGWRAYIGPVTGVSHDNEKYDVAASGTKLSETHARAIFPTIDGEYAR